MQKVLFWARNQSACVYSVHCTGQYISRISARRTNVPEGGGRKMGVGVEGFTRGITCLVCWGMGPHGACLDHCRGFIYIFNMAPIIGMYAIASTVYTLRGLDVGSGMLNVAAGFILEQLGEHAVRNPTFYRRPVGACSCMTNSGLYCLNSRPGFEQRSCKKIGQCYYQVSQPELRLVVLNFNVRICWQY